MEPAQIGLCIILGVLLLLASGVPVAFGLGLISIFSLMTFEGIEALDMIAETFYGGLNEFSLVSIPMFIVMGAAISASPAGKDLYEALARWFNWIPGGMVISNIGACSVFAALSGSSPATCAAIGKMGIPEMRKRGFSDSLATGSIAAGGTLGILIPPSVTMIVYGIATETSVGRLFLAGVVPGVLLTSLFMAWSLYSSWGDTKTYQRNQGKTVTWQDRWEVLPRVIPFLCLIMGILFVLYGGIATPSEAAGVGALASILLVIVVYRIWQPAKIWRFMLDSTRESAMILMIIGASALFSFTLSSLSVTQTMAESIANLTINKWLLNLAINIFLLVSGFFLPPVAVILMTAPILVPLLTQAGFDPYWFAVILTINMEVGLITPPVGLNLYVINSIAPEVGLKTILRGALPFMACMFLVILLLCLFPQLATWLPDFVMGPAIS